MISNRVKKQVENYLANDDYKSMFDAMVMFCVTQEYEVLLYYQKKYFEYCENGRLGEEAAEYYVRNA